MQWLPQTLLLGGAVLLAVCVRAPCVVIAGIGFLWFALVVPVVIPVRRRDSLGGLPLVVVWASTVTVPLSLFVWDSYYVSCGGIGESLRAWWWDFYCAGPVWLIAAALWLSQRRIADEAAKMRWKSPVMVWLCCGALVVLWGGYFQNGRGDFYVGLLAAAAVLVLWRAWFRPGLVAAQAVNTLILLLVGLPAADLVSHSFARPPLRPDTCQLYYSYNAAKGDPEAFGRWQEFCRQQDFLMQQAIYAPAPHTPLPYRLRPNSYGAHLNSFISINSLGFRGAEFSIDKGDAYRVVCLGESTTFGWTLQAGDKPWPELLERFIRERLKTRRPVQVINAGVPGYTINDNLYRLTNAMLALKPDLIVSYHGANGFHLIDSSVLPMSGLRGPVFRPRPLRLLAQAEFRLRMMRYRRRVLRPYARAVPASIKPLDTPYAAAYRRLIQCARTNGIRLALANYSMAVNKQSEPSVIDFYRGCLEARLDTFIAANPIHSLIVAQLAAQHPEVCLMDTHPHLDGEHEKFIDTVHLTQEGRRQLAENIFAGIRKILVEDVGQ
jgi:lysophospholipase L1-like esterase